MLIILCYDITNLKTFDNLQYWIKEIENIAPNAMITLWGNKCDLEEDRKIGYDQGSQFAKENEFIFLETSVQNNTHVHEVFEKCIQKYAATYDVGIYTPKAYDLRPIQNMNNSRSWSNGGLSFNIRHNMISADTDDYVHPKDLQHLVNYRMEEQALAYGYSGNGLHF